MKSLSVKPILQLYLNILRHLILCFFSKSNCVIFQHVFISCFKLVSSLHVMILILMFSKHFYAWNCCQFKKYLSMFQKLSDFEYEYFPQELGPVSHSFRPKAIIWFLLYEKWYVSKLSAGYVTDYKYTITGSKINRLNGRSDLKVS